MCTISLCNVVITSVVDIVWQDLLAIGVLAFAEVRYRLALTVQQAWLFTFKKKTGTILCLTRRGVFPCSSTWWNHVLLHVMLQWM